ncbi:MAG: NAD(P)H-dependent oxidoreductase [Azospirillum sp.]|nr:NAD(P)H-dependent oxidoreductase [Azospirillum sp.]
MTKILGIAGSLRAKSYNKALLAHAAKAAPEGVTVEIFDLRPIPFFDEDLEAQGYPEPVARLHAAVAAADGVLIATPEYNSGIPGVLKNALDWMSRPPGSASAAGKPVALMGASPGSMATGRAQASVAPVLLGMGMLPLTGAGVAIPNAGTAFDASGALTDARAQAAVAKCLTAFAAWIARLKPRT